MRQVILYPGEDGYWVVECPSLPGCISQGEDKAKADMPTSAKPSKVMIAALEEDRTADSRRTI